MYLLATFADIFSEADGRLRLDVTYTGDAGEPPVTLPIYVNASSPPTSDELRAQAINRLAVLNTSRTVRSGISPGAILDTTTPLPTPSAPRVQQSYMAASIPFTPGSTPQDIFTITGSATKSISVVRIGISSIQTTAGINVWHLLKRSTANTGGTSATIAAVPTISSFGVATATVRQYTANPTAGTLVGRVWTGRVPSPTATLAAAGDLEKSVVMPVDIMPVILTGVGDVLAWNFNGVALPAGLSVTAYVWWTEL